MSRTYSNGRQVLRRFVQQAESYNRCMFPNQSPVVINEPYKESNDRVTEQILFCQNQIEKLNISSTNRNSAFRKRRDKEFDGTSNEILTADIVSNGYKYETSSLELNVIQQCAVVSIISPHAFTIQLTKDLTEYDAFFKAMNDYYNSIDDLHIPQEYLRKNLLCVTWDENALAWNRSQILEYDFIDDTVNVFFVDLNSWEEHVSRSRIRFLLTKFSSAPVYLITCRLASISPSNDDQQWNDVVCKTFQNVVHNCQCDVEPLYRGRDNTFYVNLFALHDEAYVCINDFLIHCKMAKPVDDISNEKNLVYMSDDSGRPMHPMIAFYWKAGEAMREKENCIKEKDHDPGSSVSVESYQTKYSTEQETALTKMVMINESDKMVFVKFNSYIMLPWFTISNILNGLDEEKIKSIANKLGFKPILIDPLSHPSLCSQVIELVTLPVVASQLSLYSIDCVRKILQIYQYKQADVYHLLDRARLAEASADHSFWERSYEIIPFNSDEKNVYDTTSLNPYQIHNRL